MNLGVGQRVWVGWSPYVGNGGDRARCREGVLKAGPFSKDKPSNDGYPMTGRWWIVTIGDASFDVTERVIFPRDPGQDAARETEACEAEGIDR